MKTPSSYHALVQSSFIIRSNYKNGHCILKYIIITPLYANKMHYIKIMAIIYNEVAIGPAGSRLGLGLRLGFGLELG